MTKKVVRWSIVLSVLVLALTGGAAYAGSVGINLKANDKMMARVWTNAQGARLNLRPDGKFSASNLGACFGTLDRITRGELKPMDLDLSVVSGTWYVDPAGLQELSRMDLLVKLPKKYTLSVDISDAKWTYREITTTVTTGRSAAHPSLPDASCTLRAVKR